MALKDPEVLKYAFRDKAPLGLNAQLGAITAELLAEANRRHDKALHELSMDIKAKYGKVDFDRFLKRHGRSRA
jgi:hypothetical protein